MKVLMISKSGDGLGLAHYMKIHGHDVSVWIEEDRDFEFAGLGMFDKLRTWQSGLNDADLVIGDMVGFGKFEKTIRDAGKPYFGVNGGADELELDRAAQMEVFRRLGIRVPPTTTFDSPRAAKTMLDLWPDSGVVIKPSGNLDTGKTYIVRDKETYKWALSTFGGSQQLIVQERLDGVEVSTEGWFDGRRFVDELFNHTFEEKKFLEGDLGQNTGCMGNVVVLADTGSKLVEYVKRLEEPLQRIGYRGPVDINTIVNEDGAHALELTPRLGYDAVEALATMCEGDFTEQLGDFAKGALFDLKFRSILGVAVRVVLPPYPQSCDEADDRGRPIILPRDHNRKENLGYYLLTDAYFDVNMQDEDIYLYAASDGAVMKVTYADDNLDTALSSVYEGISEVTLMDAGYRTDIGARVFADVERLKELGWS